MFNVKQYMYGNNLSSMEPGVSEVGNLSPDYP